MPAAVAKLFRFGGVLSLQLALPSSNAYTSGTESKKKGKRIMGDLWILIAVVGGWFVLNRYILPKFGVST